MALKFLEGLWISHVGSIAGVGGEHCPVPVGLSALEGKLVGELLTPNFKTLLVESGQCHLMEV